VLGIPVGSMFQAWSLGLGMSAHNLSGTGPGQVRAAQPGRSDLSWTGPGQVGVLSAFAVADRRVGIVPPVLFFTIRASSSGCPSCGCTDVWARGVMAAKRESAQTEEVRRIRA